MMLLRFNDFIASISRSSAYDKNCMHRMCASLHLYLRVWQHRCGTRIFYLNWRDVNNAFVYICRLHQKHYQRIRLNNCVLCDVNVKVRYDCDLCGMLYFLKKCRKNSERCVRSRASSRQIDIFFCATTASQANREKERKKQTTKSYVLHANTAETTVSHTNKKYMYSNMKQTLNGNKRISVKDVSFSMLAAGE